MKKLTALVIGLILLAAPASAQTTRRIALMVVDFQDSEAPNASIMTWQRNDADAVQTFYAAQSYGRASVTIDTFGVFRLPLMSNATWWGEVRDHAQSAAIAAGMDPLAYDGFAYVFPIIPNHPAGIARGADVYITPWPGHVNPSGFRTLAHELGHAQFGQIHAHGYVCVGGGLVGPCTIEDYGDTWDMMGQLALGSAHFNAIKKLGRGWLDAWQVLDVTDSGDYLITPLETAGGLKGLRINPRKDATFVLEYRTGDEGPQMRLQLNGSMLVFFNYTPDVFERARHPALPVGQTWCNRDMRVALTTLAVAPEGTTVRVEFGNCR